MTEKRTIIPTEDPVCGMSVASGSGAPKGLTLTHEATEYAFCGKGCLLEFRDEPGKCLDPTYSPSV
jgi:YHS domain-containing protein